MGAQDCCQYSRLLSPNEVAQANGEVYNSQLMKFEWDPIKAATNKLKHGVSFGEATTVFGDPLAITYADPDHSADEYRFLTFGVSRKGRLLVVSHVNRQSRVRIINARQVTGNERKIYEEG
jgi:uncharacterized protein